VPIDGYGNNLCKINLLVVGAGFCMGILSVCNPFERSNIAQAQDLNPYSVDQTILGFWATSSFNESTTVPSFVPLSTKRCASMAWDRGNVAAIAWDSLPIASQPLMSLMARFLASEARV
jgi:hypothetical protein